MQAVFATVRNTLSPDLHVLYRNASNKPALHAAIGQGLVSLGKRAFNDASVRPTVWKARADGSGLIGGVARGAGGKFVSTGLLRDTGTLAKSPRVTEVSARGVTVGSDRKYAAIHQLGGRTPAHVIRPKNKQALKTPFGLFKKVNHPGSKIPARPYLPFYSNGKPTPQAVRMINSVTRARLMAGVRGAP